MINSLDQLVEQVRSLKKKYRLVVAWAHDNSTINAINKAVKNGFIEAIMLGNKTEIKKTTAIGAISS